MSEQVAVHPVSRTGGATWITRGFRVSPKTKIKIKVKVNLRRRQEERRRQERRRRRQVPRVRSFGCLRRPMNDMVRIGELLHGRGRRREISAQGLRAQGKS